MKDEDKTTEQLINELVRMRQRVAELETADTERTRAERELQKAGTRYRNLVKLAPVGIITVDRKGVVTSINRYFTTVSGFTEDEIVGRFFLKLATFRPQDLLQHWRVFGDILRGKVSGPIEYVFRRKDGTTGIAEAHIALMREEGKVAGIQVVSREVTERKQAEEALRESEELHKTLIETLPDAVAMFDLQGRFIYASPLTPELFGVESAEELIGMSGLQFIAPEQLELASKNLQSAAQKGIQKGKKYTIVRNDGTRLLSELSISPLRDTGGRTKAFVLTIRDITEQVRAEKELRQSYEKLQRALEGTIHVLVSAIEMQDPFTAGHQRQVNQLACAIANEMDLPEEQIEGIHMAALIHDIGKINTPAGILNKPGPLSDLEYALIKAHAQDGCDLLNGTVDFPWPVAQIVLQHHERMDGSGYPQGLSGEEIMLEARILGVADVVAAMASHRPYRPARGLDKALEEIARNRGVLYDPEVVDACLKLFTEKGFAFE